MYFGNEYIFESEFDQIPSEVIEFVNRLNKDIKNVREKEFTNTKFEASTKPEDRRQAAISNNYKLSTQGTIIKIILPFNGIMYNGKTNPFEYLYKFVRNEFEKSKLKDNYKYYELRLWSGNLIYATINPKLDSDANLDKMKAILSKDRNYDNYEEPVKYLDSKTVEKAIDTKKFFDVFVTKYKDKSIMSYVSGMIRIFIDSKKHSSNSLMRDYMSLDQEYDKDIMKLLDRSKSEDKDLSKEMNNVEDKFYEDKNNLFNNYIKSKIIPAINDSKKESGITKVSDTLDKIHCEYGGSRKDRHIIFVIHVY